MANRWRNCLGALALVTGASAVAVQAGPVAAQLPVGDRLPSIVSQTIAQLTGPLRFARDPQALAGLSNSIVHVDPEGRIELSFHTDRPATSADTGSLAALGAT